MHLSEKVFLRFVSNTKERPTLPYNFLHQKSHFSRINFWTPWLLAIAIVHPGEHWDAHLRLGLAAVLTPDAFKHL